MQLLFCSWSNCIHRSSFTITGLQRFDGEDLNNKARSQYQQEQLREWSEKQKQEREQALANQKEADRLYELKMRELDERAMELAKAEEECRKAINVATKDYNKALVSTILVHLNQHLDRFMYSYSSAAFFVVNILFHRHP